MRYTNELDLPQAIVDAVVNDNYSKGDADISITTLISPARQRVLAKKHADELVEDVSERIFVLLGQIMHGILDRAATGIAARFAGVVHDLIITGRVSKPLAKLLYKVRDKIFVLFPRALNAIFEERFYANIEGVKISGQLDAYYRKGLVQDYKLVSLYSVKDGVKEEYEQQLNCYAALLRLNGLVVSRLELVCILRDWSKNKARGDETLPQRQVIKLEVPVWSQEDALAFLTSRVLTHKEANKTLPFCTFEERWAVMDKWAVMPKKGAARASKLHDNVEDAKEHSKNVTGSFVEFRPGVNNRCDAYCVVSQFCKQYEALKARKKETISE